MRRLVMISALLGLMAATAGWAQESPATETEPQATPAAPDAPQPRMTDEEKARLMKYWKTKPDQTWSEFVADWLTPKPFSKKYAVKINDKYAYPHIAASIKMEIVREDEDTVWLRGIPPENPESPLFPVWARAQANEALYLDQVEAMQTPGAVYFLDFRAEPLPPPFQDAMYFRRVPGDLPKAGRFQMSFAVADMNGDGADDLVFPPARKGMMGRPFIFLNRGEGRFEPWKDVVWPANLALDYGGVAVADLNADGHQDIVLAVHFAPQFVLYGEGEGRFTRVEKLPSLDRRLSSRAVTVDDFNGDGRPDLAFAAEVDFDLSTTETIDDAPCVWVLLNTKDGWKIDTTGLPERLIADVIQSADMDRDGRPDLVLSSNSNGERRLVYLNRGDDGWQPAVFKGVLSSAYHYGVAADEDQIFATFIQFNMIDGKAQARNGLIRYPISYSQEVWEDGVPLVFDKDRVDVYFRIAVGDVNGDGRSDVVASRKNGGLELYVQNTEGEFVLERSPELDATGVAYDIQLVDVDKDGRDDIIAGFAPAGGSSGGIGVWLSGPRSD